MQHTLSNQITFRGKGLHSGKDVSMTVMPAEINQGIVFIRRDVKDRNNSVEAKWNFVEASQLCTLLKNDAGVTVSTIEHLMAAFAGMAIDNATIILDSAEVPIMDGSSLPFVEGFERVGIQPQDAPRSAIRIVKPIEVTDTDGRIAKFVPDVSSVFEFTIDFDNDLIALQNLVFELDGSDDFRNELADCRTFTRLKDVKALQDAGLIKGGGLDNAVVFDDTEILNPEGLRRNDEPVRHKVLDAIGDIALAGAPIIGRYISEKGGHALTNKLLRQMFANPDCYVLTTDMLGIAQDNTAQFAMKPAYN